MEIEKVGINTIKNNPKNPRTIKNDKFQKLVKSIIEFPQMLEVRPIVVDDDGFVLGGNMRLKACREAGLKEVPIIRFNNLTEKQKDEFIVKDNASFGDWDFQLLKTEWDEKLLIDWSIDIPKESYQKSHPNVGSALHERFVAPPFSILDTKQGYWSDRKKIWRELIGDNGESRQNTLVENPDCAMGAINNGVSLLDPVLSEIITKWFSPLKSNIFDPFAGDTVFGYVSTYENHNKFIGIELREEQATLNNERTCERATYICDDGRNVDKHIEKGTQDLLFSCPPYYDLEVYSDLENDASNQETYEEFFEIIDDAFTKSIKCLKDNRFAVIVVGDVRDKDGFYYDYPGDIKRLFMREGMKLYNDIILSDAIGTAGMRANSFMRKRKVVKVHQNVLVFYKGGIETIPNDFPSLDFDREKFII